jgi:hypothetical protein
MRSVMFTVRAIAITNAPTTFANPSVRRRGRVQAAGTVPARTPSFGSVDFDIEVLLEMR